MKLTNDRCELHRRETRQIRRGRSDHDGDEPHRRSGPRLRARIVRGASEVGGSCVEVEASGSRLVVDLGRPLGAGLDEEVPLPAIRGLDDGTDPTLLAVLISHAHADHYGLVSQLPESVPVFIGAAAARILDAAAFFSPAGLRRTWDGYLRDAETVEIGPFRVTPLLVDHSAHDAYAFVIEAGGRTLLYSGDLRGHGSQPEVFDRLLARIPPRVDALLLEGTRIGRKAGPQVEIATEEDVEGAVASVCDEAAGLVLVAYSAQNLDRLKVVHRAAQLAGRELLIDPYVEAVAEAASDPSLPRVGSRGTKLYVPQSMRVRIKESGEFDRLNMLRRHRIFPESLAAHPDRFVLTFRPSMLDELERAGSLEESRLIWSMWPGYLQEERMTRFNRSLAQLGLPLAVVHASGHATTEDLQRVTRAASAARVVPIHTAVPERYSELFDNVELHPDGEWWTV